MSKQQREETGKFASKSDEVRQVRSIRLTETTWNKLGELANLRGITRADFIEELREHDYFDNFINLVDDEAVVTIEQQKAVINSLTKELEELHDENKFLMESKLEQLESLKESVLFSLKLGKQAPAYKTAQKALGRFIKELLSQPV